MMLAVYMITLGLIAEIGYYYFDILYHLKYTKMVLKRYRFQLVQWLFYDLSLWFILNTLFIGVLVWGLLDGNLLYRYALFLLSLVICLTEECVRKLFNNHNQDLKQLMHV